MSVGMKEVLFSAHARERMRERGATEAEVLDAIETGERAPAREGRAEYRKVFPFHGLWQGRRYWEKEVVAVVAEEETRAVVVTVFVFYRGVEG